MIDNNGSISATNSTDVEEIDADETTILAKTRLHTQPTSPCPSVGSCLKERFILEEEIGRGGMGVVYRALDLRKQETEDREPYIAIKLITAELKDTKASLISLQREAKKSQKLAHPNVATVYDFDRDGNDAYLCMELLEGEPLSDFLKHSINRGLPFEEALPIIQGMARGLAYAHSENIVHSDFKPGNVFITNNGNVKILDFGIARASNTAENGNDQTVFDAGMWGAITPRYASPEMFLGKDPDPRDDIYALGCVAYQLLTGKHPYNGETSIKAIEAKLSPPTIKGISREANRILKQSVSLSRESRTLTIEKFLNGIEPPSPNNKRLLPAMLTITVLVALSFAGWWQFDRIGEDRATGPENSIWFAKAKKIPATSQSKIDRLFEVADAHASVGRYLSPPTSNAAEVYVAILKLQPGNTKALEITGAIADAVKRKINKLRSENKISEARDTLKEALIAMPEQPTLKKLQELPELEKTSGSE